VPPRHRTPPVPAHVPEVEAHVPESDPAPATPPAPAAMPAGQFPLGVGALWVAVAIIVGVGLRFLKLPDYVVPVLIGVGVGSLVGIVAKYLMASGEAKPADAAAPPPPPPEPTTARSNESKRRARRPARGRSDA
jgi:hypothetical protein